MKKVGIILILLLAFGSLSTVSAQTLGKKEKKALKKEIKTYKKNPVKWVRMQNSHKKEVKDLNDALKLQRSKLDASNAQNKELQGQLASLQGKFNELNAKYNNLLKNAPSTVLPKGTVYQVQMGYYQHLDLLSFNNKLKTVKAEEIDGAKRYVIGHFNDVLDAVQFSNDIKSLGISDAFVSQYVDGVRNMEFDALNSINK